MQPSSPPNPEFHLRNAKKLLKAIKAGDPLAIRRARAVFLDVRDIPDTAVPEHMGLQRCQHVIAKENGFDNWAAQKHAWDHRTQVSGWASYMDSGHYRVLTAFDSPGIASLKSAAMGKSTPALVRYMLVEPASLSWDYNSIATRQQCREFFAWALTVLKFENANIETDGLITLHDGLFRLQPITPDEYEGIRQSIEDDPGTDWMPGMDD